MRFHIGTSEIIGRLSYKNAENTAETLIRLYLEQPLAAGLGDQGLLRRYSPQNIIGGITLLKPLERGVQKKELLEQLAWDYKGNDMPGMMFDLLGLAKEPLTMSEWVARAGFLNTGRVSKAISGLLNENKVKKAGNYYLTNSQLLQFETKLGEILASFHRQKPSEPGISREILRQQLRLPEQIADWFFQHEAKHEAVRVHEEFIASPSHAVRHGDVKNQLMIQFEAVMPTQEIVEVTAEWLAEKMKRPLTEIKPFFETLVREKILIRLTGVHVYRKTIQYIGSVIQQHFNSHATLSVGELRDLLNTSRRLVIPVLEYFDAHKYTMRKEDSRVPGPNLNNLSE